MARKGTRTRTRRGSKATSERSDRDRPTRADTGSGSESLDRRVESLHRAAGNQAMQSAGRGGTTATADRSNGETAERVDRSADESGTETADRRGEEGFELAAERVMRSPEGARTGGGPSPPGDGASNPGGRPDAASGVAGNGGTRESGSGPGSVEDVDPRTVREKQRRGDDVAVVDVRSPSSFDEGHVPGATNVPMGELARKPAPVDGADEVVSCCRSGRRSEAAARMMADEGGPPVHNMAGGYERWETEVGEGETGGGSAGTDASRDPSGGESDARDPSSGDGSPGGTPAVGGEPVQAKLSVSQPGDRNEREAERMAQQVMRMDDPGRATGSGAAATAAGGSATAATAGSATTVGGSATRAGGAVAAGGTSAARSTAGTCSQCGEREVTPSTCTDCGGTIQRSACSECEELRRSTCTECEDDIQRSTAEGEGRGDVESQVEAARSGGQPLSGEARSFFEPRFGADFGDVTVHTGSQADAAARAVNAEAFTVGTDVVFREGAYDPASRSGKELLAHELAHVVQQNDVGGKGVAQRQAAESGAAAGAGEGVAREGSEGPTGSEAFLPLQISCLRQAGGCGMGSMALPQLNDVCRSAGFPPVPPTNYEGPDLTQEDLQCGTSLGKVVANTVEETYAGWLNALPDCPCTVEDAKANGEFEDTKGPWSENMHPGAEYDFRATGYSSVSGTHHGQQCMYDAAGQLITEGAGRGTPDVWGPQPLTYWPYHRAIDIVPSEDLSAGQYRDVWTPNTGKNCGGNSTGVTLGGGQDEESATAEGAAGGAAGGASAAGTAKREGSGGGSGSGGSGGGSSGGCGSGGWEYEVDGCSVPDVVTAKGGGYKGVDANVFYSADRPMGEDGVEFGAGSASSDLPCDVHDRDYQTCESEFDEEKLSGLPDPGSFDSHEELWQAYREAGALLVDYDWKEEADDKFEEGMKEQCANRYEGETAWFSDTPYEDCVDTAEMYRAGVSDAFSDAYRKRQYQACTCELKHDPGSVGVGEGSFWRNVPGVGEGPTFPW